MRRLDLSEIQETAFIRRGANFSFGQTAYPDGGEFRVTSGAYAALILLETGTMSTVIDRNRRELHAGECGIFINRTGRRSTYAPGSRVMWCETPLLKSALPARSDFLGDRVRASQRILTLFREGINCGLNSSPTLDTLRNALGEALFAAWRIEAGQDVIGHMPPSLIAAKSYIDQHYAEKPALEQLASVAGVTPPYLIDLFRRHQGTTPIRYLRNVRAQAALRLIRHTDMSLASIADITGYGSAFHLSREVRLMNGQSPRSIRQRGIHGQTSHTMGDATRLPNDQYQSLRPAFERIRPMVPPIPVIDIAALRHGSSAERKVVAAALGRACREAGFFYITGHGVAPEMMNKLFEASRIFFNQPANAKEKVAMSRLGKNRGYVGLGVERLDTTSLPDNKEAFNISPHNVDDADVWPDLPGWRDLMMAYFTTCLDIGAALHRGFARDLGVDENFFVDKFKNPMATLRLLRYPPSLSKRADQAPGAGAHTDYGNVTILAVNGVSGLQVRPRGSDWMDAPLIPGTFICNIGDCLMRWSNDVYVSTPHRVLRPEGERYSIAFFLDPDADAQVEPIVSQQDESPHYPPVSGYDYLQERLQATYGHQS